jgi:uncharacterized membrane protein HdeD (DUF308 family)
MVSTSGFIVGILGGLLDFASATNLVLYPAPETGMMTSTPSDLGWILGLYALGAIVIATSVLSVTWFGLGRPKLFSGLMMVYGILMVVVGWVMITGSMVGTTEVLLYGYGMAIVGILMVVDGTIMMRNPMSV